MSGKIINLTESPVKTLIPRLALPVMLAGLLRTSYGFVDMIFASRLGGLQVASVAFITPLFNVIQALGLGISTGGIGVIAKHLGEGNRKEASDSAFQLRSVILILSVLVIFIGLFLTPGNLSLLGLEGELLENSYRYSAILLYSLPFFMIIQLYMSLFKAQGKMGIVSWIALAGVILNTLFNSLFVIIFDLGIEGLAAATLLTQVLQAVFITVYYHLSSHDFELTLSPFRGSFNREKCRAVLKVGLPLSFSHGSVQFGFLVINSIIAPYGYQVVAAFAIGNQVNSILYSPSMGLGQAMVPLVAQNWGAGKIERVRESIRTGLGFSTIYGFIGALLILMLRTPVGGFLSKNDPVIVAHVENYSGLMAWALVSWALFQSLSGIFNGFQRTDLTMGLTVFRLWGLRIPGVLLFRFFLPSFAEYGVWITMFASNMIALAGAFLLYFLNISKGMKRDFEIDRW